MLSDDGAHLRIDWQGYYRLIEDLAARIHASGWTFDQIVCLARGGLRAGDVLSRIFDKPLGILFTSSYRADAGKSRGALDIGAHVAFATDTLGGRVLLVDDMADSGITLEAVVAHLQAQPGVTELRSAVLWTKGTSVFLPDYVIQHLPTSPWIHQPFEVYDGMGIEGLLARMAARSQPPGGAQAD